MITSDELNSVWNEIQAFPEYDEIVSTAYVDEIENQCKEALLRFEEEIK